MSYSKEFTETLKSLKGRRVWIRSKATQQRRYVSWNKALGEVTVHAEIDEVNHVRWKYHWRTCVADGNVFPDAMEHQVHGSKHNRSEGYSNNLREVKQGCLKLLRGEA